MNNINNYIINKRNKKYKYDDNSQNYINEEDINYANKAGGDNDDISEIDIIMRT